MKALVMLSIANPWYRHSSSPASRDWTTLLTPLLSSSPHRDRFASLTRAVDKDGRPGWQLGAPDVTGAARIFFAIADADLDAQVLEEGLHMVEMLELDDSRALVVVEMHPPEDPADPEASSSRRGSLNVYVTHAGAKDR